MDICQVFWVREDYCSFDLLFSCRLSSWK